MRFILQTATDVDLPSTNAASFYAVSTVSGQQPKGYAPDQESSFTPQEKVRLLRAIHETDLCHAGSHKGVLEILAKLGKSWKHADKDARFTVRRCDRCCRATARGTAEAPVGNLPKPLHSGQCVGVDLKTVIPDDESPKWVMLLLVDFTSGKVFGWDLDFKAATLDVVQDRVVNDFMVNNDPPEIMWSDNASQFRSVLEEVLRLLLNVRSVFIPVGHPASNGYVEALNRVIDGMHGGDRRKFRMAITAYNTKTKPRVGLPPETIWRATRPLTSKWTHLAVNRELEDLSRGKKGDLMAPDGPPATQELLDDYATRVKQWEDSGGLAAAVASFSERMDPVVQTIADKNDRADMRVRLKWKRSKARAKNFAFVSGDYVLLKNKQYAAATKHTPFESNLFEVVNVMANVVELRNASNGNKRMAHYNDLKLHPAAPSAPDPPANLFVPIDVPRDGSCLFYALAYEQRRLAGLHPPSNEEQRCEGQSLRLGITEENRRYVADLNPDDRLALEWQVTSELQQTVRYEFSTWPEYFVAHSGKEFYASFFSIAGFERLHGLGVTVWMLSEAAGGYFMIRDARGDGFPPEKICHVLGDGGNHYQVLTVRQPPEMWKLLPRQGPGAGVAGPAQPLPVPDATYEDSKGRESEASDCPVAPPPKKQKTIPQMIPSVRPVVRFDDIGEYPDTYHDVQCVALKQKTEDFRVNAGRKSITTTSVVLAGDKFQCNLMVNADSRHRTWLAAARDANAEGEHATVALSLKAEEKKGRAILRLRPRTTPRVIKTTKGHQKKRKLLRITK